MGGKFAFSAHFTFSLLFPQFLHSKTLIVVFCVTNLADISGPTRVVICALSTLAGTCDASFRCPFETNCKSSVITSLNKLERNKSAGYPNSKQGSLWILLMKVIGKPHGYLLSIQHSRNNHTARINSLRNKHQLNMFQQLLPNMQFCDIFFPGARFCI